MTRRETVRSEVDLLTLARQKPLNLSLEGNFVLFCQKCFRCTIYAACSSLNKFPLACSSCYNSSYNSGCLANIGKQKKQQLRLKTVNEAAKNRREKAATRASFFLPRQQVTRPAYLLLQLKAYAEFITARRPVLLGPIEVLLVILDRSQTFN